MTTTTTAKVPTPELDCQREIIDSGKAAVVQEFLDWLLDDQHYELGRTDPDSRRGYLLPVSVSRPALMEKFFNIDANKIEAERRAFLEPLRTQ